MGMKQWTKASKPLDNTPYNVSSKDLKHFMSKLSRQAFDSGRGNITKPNRYEIFHKYRYFSVQDT